MLYGALLMGVLLFVAAALDYYVMMYSTTGDLPNPQKAKIFGASAAAVIYVYTCVFGATWITAGRLLNIRYLLTSLYIRMVISHRGTHDHFFDMLTIVDLSYCNKSTRRRLV